MAVQQRDQPGYFVKRMGGRVQGIGRAVAPGPRAWRGAAWGLLGGLGMVLLAAALAAFPGVGPINFGIATLLLLVAVASAGLLLVLLVRLLAALPALYSWALACGLALFVLLALPAFTALFGVIAVFAGLTVTLSLLGAAVATLRRGGWARATLAQRVIVATSLGLGLAGAGVGAAWLLWPGAALPPPPNAARLAGAPLARLDRPDPSQPGAYAVETLCYSSGAGRWSAACSAATTLTAEPVDGSAFVANWSRRRAGYWGFGPEALPLNGRVWRPVGAGPFPLVLVVHGNAPMEQLSDPGYAYLGELLASRGFIAVSVDQNFLNMSPFADTLFFNKLHDENDARGWLLLEHLRQWHAWNADPAGPFYGQVDTANIALIGHSRGGEAAAIAAAFNRLPAYPDDANVRFDYNFAIRSIAAIAPSDSQYTPSDVNLPLKNVNYFVLHGAHDMDVITFMGSRQYTRVRFTDDQFWFKAALYIYGANHGQFNTVWGRTDLDDLTMRLFNLRQLLPAADQEQIARVYIAAFLEATLHGERDWLPLFRDYRSAPGWLPDTIYLNQYSDSATQTISNYEEDINPATATLAGGVHTGAHLTVWREQLVPARWQNMDNKAVYLGWDGRAQPEAASYTIALPAEGPPPPPDSALVFDLAAAAERPDPASPAPWPDAMARPPLDFTVEVRDRAGNAARLALSDRALLQPPIATTLTKARFMFVLPPSEVVFQTFEFPLAAFAAANPAFDPAALAGVSLIFDRTEAGVVVLDNVGLRRE